MAKRRSRFAFARFGCFGGQARAEKMAEDVYPVKLHIYDLSQGMARQLSTTILGKAIEGIWHTGVVVYGREYYFGGGIQQDQPGQTPYGTPVRVEDLGVTHVPREVFQDFLREIGPRYTPATYSLLTHNCNNFSNEAAQFLTSAAVPSYILELPTQVMNSPIGALIMPMIQGLETSLRAGAVPQPPQFRLAPAPAAVATAITPSTNDVEAADKPEAPSVTEVGARPAAAADEPEAGEMAGNGNDNDGSAAVPPSVQPVAAAPPAAATLVNTTKPSANGIEARSTGADKLEARMTKEVEAGSAAADEPEAGETAGHSEDTDSSPAVRAVQLAAVAPPEAATLVNATKPSANDVEARSTGVDKPEAPATKEVETRPAAADEPEVGQTVSNGDDTDSSPPVPPVVLPATAVPPAAAAQVSVAAPPDPLVEAKSRAHEEVRREFAAHHGGRHGAGQRGGRPRHAPRHGAARQAVRRGGGAARVGVGSAIASACGVVASGRRPCKLPVKSRFVKIVDRMVSWSDAFA
ncbi:unnamed protein product [Urochloa humidicola]